jgi:hypothetical protein
MEELLAEAADGLEVEVVATSAGTEWRRIGRPFAAADAGVAEFWLDPAVAAAALRTPATGVSPRGRDWVAFRPAELDDHALDRAEAWFGSAWRRAERP